MVDISITTWHGICLVVMDTIALRSTVRRSEEDWLLITRDSLRKFKRNEEKRFIAQKSGWSWCRQQYSSCYCCRIEQATSELLSVFCMLISRPIKSKKLQLQ